MASRRTSRRTSQTKLQVRRENDSPTKLEFWLINILQREREIEEERSHDCCFSIDGAEHPDVVTVLESKMLKLHTTRSWDFMDLERDGQILPESIWKHAKFGQDVIIANLDSGRKD